MRFSEKKLAANMIKEGTLAHNQKPKHLVSTAKLLLKPGAEAQIIQGKEGGVPFLKAALISNRIE